jgi:hypothetical protein
MEKTKLTGTLIHKGQTIQVSEKFSKREFVIETQDKFPQQILLQLVNDRTDVIENLRVGDLLDVFYNVRGRAWTDPKTQQTKWFNTIEAWAVTFANANAQTPAPHTTAQANYPQTNGDNVQPYQNRQQMNYKDNDPLGFDQPFNLPM